MADAPAEAGSSIDGAAAPVTIMSQLKWMEEAEEEVRAQAFDARETCVADPSRIMCVGGTGRLGSSHQGDAWCAREACGERSGTFASPRACRCRQRFFLLTKPHARSHDRRATSGWAAGKWCYGSRASCTRRRALSATRRLQRTRCVCLRASWLLSLTRRAHLHRGVCVCAALALPLVSQRPIGRVKRIEFKDVKEIEELEYGEFVLQCSKRDYTFKARMRSHRGSVSCLPKRAPRPRSLPDARSLTLAP